MMVVDQVGSRDHEFVVTNVSDEVAALDREANRQCDRSKATISRIVAGR